jgi:nucleotide-binding universal stress UspA family protein
MIERQEEIPMIRDILAFADESLLSDSRFALPAGLARRYGANLSAVHILVDAIGYIPVEVGPGAGEIVRAQVEAAREAASGVEKKYRAQRSAHAFEGEWHLAKDWWDAVAMAGRHDLIIAGQSASGLPTLLSNVRPEDVAIAVGRPTLVVPATGRFESCGERVIIGWKPTKEAARAIHDALPLISANAAVQIVEVSDEEPSLAARRSGSDALRQHLARHGIKATVETLKGSDSTVCDKILERASAHKADLIVMGAYGHSRLREMILGGVTRTMLQRMTTPVLFSH